MGAKGQAKPGLSQIQDIPHHTLKKHEQLLGLNVCCPLEENLNEYLIYDIILLKAMTGGCCFYVLQKNPTFQSLDLQLCL